LTASTGYLNQDEVSNLRDLGKFNGNGSTQKANLRLVAPQGQIQVHMTSYRGSFPIVLSEALRSAGLGSEVLIAQFLKGGVEQGVTKAIKLCGKLSWIRPNLPYSLGHKTIAKDPESEEFLEAKEAIREIWQICKDRLLRKTIQKLVLDEIGLAIQLGLLEEEELISTLEDRLSSIDVILTGPSIPPKVIAMADQVTELRCSK